MRICLCIAVILAAGAASAAPDPAAILRRTYDNYRSSGSQSRVAMTIHRPDWERSMTMTAATRGDDDALVRFTAPARDAGNATLKLGRDTWIFNPKVNQVIKLPASMMGRSWMGSDFSYDDLSKSEDLLTFYAHRLAATEKAGGHEVWVIDCTPLAGAPVVWGKVELKVRDDLVIVEETFFDQDMRPARRMTADRVGVIGARVYPITMTMHPLDQPGQWTRVDTLEARFEVKSPAWVFTLSNLQNPRP